MIDPKTVPAECFRPFASFSLTDAAFRERIRQHRKMIRQQDEIVHAPGEAEPDVGILQGEAYAWLAREYAKLGVEGSVWLKIDMSQLPRLRLLPPEQDVSQSAAGSKRDQGGEA